MGVLEFLNFFKSCLNSERVIIMFLLLSKQFEIMLDVADNLCAEYREQFVCIAEDESISKPWMEKLLAMECVDAGTLKSQVIAPLPWAHSKRKYTRNHWQGTNRPGETSNSSHGTRIELPDRIRNQLCNLEVVGASHCDGSCCDIINIINLPVATGPASTKLA